MATAVYVLNLSPTKAMLNQTPYEAFKCPQPSVTHLQVFDCIAYTLINTRDHHKFDIKSEKCVFIGYCNETKGYKLYNPITRTVIVSRNVIFSEGDSWS